MLVRDNDEFEDSTVMFVIDDTVGELIQLHKIISFMDIASIRILYN